MGIQLFTNNASGTLAGPLTTGSLSLSMTSGQGSLFPIIAGGSGNWFIATLQHIVSNVVTASEIIKVTSTATDTFTIVRAQESNSALSWSAGDTLALLPTAGGMSGFAQAQSGFFTLTATGMSGSVAGTAFYRIVGPVCTLQLPYLGGTSNSATFTATGLPAVCQPNSYAGSLNNTIPLAIAVNNSLFISGAYASIAASSGTISFGFLGFLGIWNTSGTKAVAGTITYILA